MSKPLLKAGALRQVINIVTPNHTQDSMGGTKADDASIFATVRASIEALSGRELFAAQQKVSEVTHQVTVRYFPGINSSMNVWFDGRQFLILAVEDPDERKFTLNLLCKEIENSAYQIPG